jgi:hypothetical protein
VHLHVLRTEAVLKIDQVDRVSVGGVDLAVDEECLAGQQAVMSSQHLTVLKSSMSRSLSATTMADQASSAVMSGRPVGKTSMRGSVQLALLWPGLSEENPKCGQHTFFAAAEARLRRLLRALAGAVAFTIADPAFAREDSGVRALSLVVAVLTAIEAGSSLLLGLRALSRHVARLAAAGEVSRSRSWTADILVAVVATLATASASSSLEAIAIAEAVVIAKAVVIAVATSIIGGAPACNVSAINRCIGTYHCSEFPTLSPCQLKIHTEGVKSLVGRREGTYGQPSREV